MACSGGSTEGEGDSDNVLHQLVNIIVPSDKGDEKKAPYAPPILDSHRDIAMMI